MLKTMPLYSPKQFLQLLQVSEIVQHNLKKGDNELLAIITACLWNYVWRSCTFTVFEFGEKSNSAKMDLLITAFIAEMKKKGNNVKDLDEAHNATSTLRG